MKRMRNERNLTMTEIALGIRFVTPSKICQKIAEMRQNYRGKNPGEFVMSPARTRYRIPDKLKIQGKGKRTPKSAKIAEMRKNCRGKNPGEFVMSRIAPRCGGSSLAATPRHEYRLRHVGCNERALDTRPTATGSAARFPRAQTHGEGNDRASGSRGRTVGISLAS